ncbi:MAG: phosphoribosylformylglycinamidine synthase subunit PurL [bacterium]
MGESTLLPISIRRASDDELVRLSRERLLSLTLKEMKAVQSHYASLNREPRFIELETIAQTWSEHCKHKTFRALITLDGIIIDDLLKSTIIRATRELNKDWCVSVFKDNAGIIRFDEKHDIAFKVETHNHPSALEPYGGAGTGIGGVIRDILGVGLGAKPIFNTDVFCFGTLDLAPGRIPHGVFHPVRILKGVVSGVRDYGNRMGIPTISGAVCFHDDFVCNPLVYCGTAGIIPAGNALKKVHTGDLIVAAGGKTGRDGIHGATFSSLELTADSDVSAVQIGNPIEEKKLSAALLACRDEKLYHSLTDCGAGGFSSAVGEMAEGHGAKVYLEKAPLKYAGLTPWEIWVSEAQERMVMAVPPKNLKRVEEIFTQEDAAATVIGEFTDSGKLELMFNDKLEGELDLNFLHEGIPRLNLTGQWEKPDETDPSIMAKDSLGAILKGIIGLPDIASKEWIIRQYDHEVQGATILKPLQGAAMDGPGDASVVRPDPDTNKGVVVSHGINVHYGKIDPYCMAACVIEEALRNIVCAGGNLNRTALLDNFCWGDPNDPKMIGGLVRACNACYDFSMNYGTPFISGKDSLNNTFRDSKDQALRSIPSTLLISAISVIDDISSVISFEFKKPGNLIYVVGKTFRELGGSQYYYYLECTGGRVPRVDKKISLETLKLISGLIKKRLVSACHDCSEGGLGTAIAEMAFSGDCGAEISVASIIRDNSITKDEEILFSESQSRFIIEVSPKNKKIVEKELQSIPFACAGKVTQKHALTIQGLDGRISAELTIKELKSAWKNMSSSL